MSENSPRPPRIPRAVGKKSIQGAAGAKRTKSSTTAKSAGGNATAKWVVRGVVGGLLIGLLVLAGIDFSRKGQMTKTGNAWTAAFDQSVASGQPLEFSKLEPMIVGSPVRSERQSAAAPTTNVNVSKTYSYAWNGIFRTYSIDLHVDQEPGSNPIVSKIDIPGGK